MKPEQVQIAAWMRAQLVRLHLRPEQWAKAAHVSPTSVTRAMQTEYHSVTSIPTLVALAKAAGTPTVLDFLASQTNGMARSPAPSTLRPILRAVLGRVGSPQLSETMLDQVAEAVAFALALVSRNPTADEDPLALQVAADAAASRILT